KLLNKVSAELEVPREDRPFGSGWLSGSIGLLLGIVGLLMVIALRNPSLTTVPQLVDLYRGIPFRLICYVVLFAGFVLASLSLVLRKDKTLGSAAMVATLLGTMLGSLPAHEDIKLGGLFVGLDFFLLNVLFTGLLFIPVERIFPHRREQPVFREEWR